MKDCKGTPRRNVLHQRSIRGSKRKFYQSEGASRGYAHHGGKVNTSEGICPSQLVQRLVLVLQVLDIDGGVQAAASDGLEEFLASRIQRAHSPGLFIEPAGEPTARRMTKGTI